MAHAELSTFIMSTVGCLLFAIGVVCFTLPYKFPDIGAIGIVVLLKYAFGFSPSVTNLVINAGLILWAAESSQSDLSFGAYTIFLCFPSCSALSPLLTFPT